MAISLAFSKNPAIIGDSISLIAAGDGAYMNFEFLKGTDSLASSPTSTFNIASVKSTDAGEYTVVATLSGGDTETAKSTLTVNKKTITGFSLEVDLDKSSYTIGDNYTATAKPNQNLSGATYAYEWTVNGVPKAGSTATLTGIAEAKGTLSVVCKVVISGADYTTYTSGNVTAQAPINNKVANSSMTLSSDKESYVAGDQYTITAVIKDAPEPTPPNGTVGYVYTWKVEGQVVNESNSSLSGEFEEAGNLNISCDVHIVATNYDAIDLSKSLSIAAVDKVPEGGYLYFNPIPWRETGFIRIGWWVIDEISKAEELGLDWKTAPDPLKYKSELLTLAHMFTLYDDVEVQESRNGYVWNKAQIEAGYVFY